MPMSTKNHELVKSLNWLSTGNPNVPDAQRAMADAAKAITLLEEHTDKLVENVGEATLKYQEQERDYILPLYEWAKKRGFNLEKLVTDNPGKNCTELFLWRIDAAIEELKLKFDDDRVLDRITPTPEQTVTVKLDYEADQKTGDVRIVKRPAQPEPIPCGVYFSEEHLNFYNFQTGKGMGQLFFYKWIDRQSEFSRKP